MNKITLLFLIALLWGCANRVPPTGGPKDEDPPVLLKSTPENGARNVAQNTLELTFDEFVVLKNIKDQLIITPRVDFEYDYKIKKQTITFEFEEALNDSTTYTFNFREGIVDMTEGTSAEQLVIAFSTGPMLDTLEITGQIVNLMTGKSNEKAVVGLYEETDTTDLFTSSPLYFTNTLEDGTYTFRNIKDGNYRLYAFVDNNKNLTCQSDGEAYGFLNEIIKLDSNINLEPIPVQHLNIDTLKVNRVQQSGHYVILTANKYLSEASLVAEDSQAVQFSYEEDRKGLKIYNTVEIEDSLHIQAFLTDSTGTELNYEFYLKYEETTRRKDEFKSNLTKLIGSIQTKKITGSFIFDKPIKSITLDSVRIERDSTMIIMVKDKIVLTPDTTRTLYELQIPFPQQMLDSLTNTPTGAKEKMDSRGGRGKAKGGGTYTLVIPHGTFFTVDSDTSQSINKGIDILKPAQLGVIQGGVHTSHLSYEIQLVNEKFEVIKKTGPGSSYKFSEVKPGEYLVRILIDSNNNGRWEPGDIREGVIPEPVIIYADPNGVQKTSIRANWEMTFDLFF